MKNDDIGINLEKYLKMKKLSGRKINEIKVPITLDWNTKTKESALLYANANQNHINYKMYLPTDKVLTLILLQMIHITHTWKCFLVMMGELWPKCVCICTKHYFSHTDQEVIHGYKTAQGIRGALWITNNRDSWRWYGIAGSW